VMPAVSGCIARELLSLVLSVVSGAGPFNHE
jgi:hypothetical protein